MTAPPPFEAAVRAAIKALRPGEVVTYGEVAARAGRPGAARAVGQVLSRTGGLPWWRVVRAGGWMAVGHEERQSAQLAAEGVEVRAGRIADPRLRERLRPDLSIDAALVRRKGRR